MNAVTVGQRDETGKLVFVPSTPKQKARFAEMLAARRAPITTGLDRSFMEGMHNNHGLDGKPWLKEISIESARRAGIDISGKVYKSGIADWRGPADPRAWVSSRDEAEAVIKERRMFSRGAINHEPEIMEPPPHVPLAEDLIRESVAEELQQHPLANPRELREKVIEKHGMNKKPRSKHYGPKGEFVL